MKVKKPWCLLALTLLFFSFQACRREAEKGDLSAQPAAQSQASPQSTPLQPGEAVVPAPSTFNEVFAGAIDNRNAIRMNLERKGDNLGGSYSYERAGAFNVAMRTLELKGRIDGEGNVSLTEMTENYKTGKPIKTGEVKGKLDGLSANGDTRLRFSGTWTGAKGAKQMPFDLQQLRYGLGGLKLGRKEQRSEDKKLR